jgi:hypothetical protein
MSRRLLVRLLTGGLALALGAGLGAGSARAQVFTGTFAQDDEKVVFTFTVGDVNGGAAVYTTSYDTGGFDPILTAFDSGGSFAKESTAGDGTRDASLSFSAEEAGSYTLVLTQYDNFSAGEVLSSGFLRDGQGNFTATECDTSEPFQRLVDYCDGSSTGDWTVVFEGADNVQQVIEGPEVSCPNDQNPWGTAAGPGTLNHLLVYTSDVDTPWSGCNNFAYAMDFGSGNRIPIFATAGNTPSDAEGGEQACRKIPLVENPVADEDFLIAGGDEICAIDVIFDLRGGPGTIDGFDPSAALPADVQVQTFIKPNQRELRLIVLATQSPLGGGDFYHYLGDLRVTVLNSEDPLVLNNGVVTVVAKAGVGANGVENTAEGTGFVRASLVGGQAITNVVALPEPGVWLQLPAALAGLGLAAALRRRWKR